MKVTFVNTSDKRGGASIAASRLFNLIHKSNPGTRMIVGEKLGKEVDVVDLNPGLFRKSLRNLRFLVERVAYIVKSSSKDYWFAFSPANTGQDISKKPEIQGADIIHLHWVNSGFLSLKNIQEIINAGKPVVWTLHDLWAFTGGCHYSGYCSNYTHNCGDCYYMKDRGKNDLSHHIHQKKQELFNANNISFIAVSNWMAECARNSSLIGNCRIEVLPNPLDTDIYSPGDKFAARKELGLPADKFLILSGAANLKDKRKGFKFLLESLVEMNEKDPGMADRFGLITFGKSSEADECVIPVYPQAYMKDERAIARLYQASDVFVLPSLEDNLPSTVMESLSCGIPVVAFNTGGIPDMVEHKSTGYLADLKNVADLSAGIKWVKDHPEIEHLKNNCRKKVVENYSHEVLSTKYINFYQSLLSI